MESQKPNAAQIRGALGLLRWENEDLANACGITPQSISNIKRGTTRPQPRILASIRNIFESHGIEFLENSGVRFMPEGVEVLNGVKGMKKFFDMAYAYAQNNECNFRQNGIGDGVFLKCWPNIVEEHKGRMDELARIQKARNNKNGALVRVISMEEDYDFICTEYAEYRWHPKNVPPPVPYYVFGDSVGIFAFDSDPPPKIVLITSPTIAREYANQFDRTWEFARKPAPKQENKGKS